jgi:signal transduction histidine kinase
MAEQDEPKPTARRPLSEEDIEFRRWLLDIERRAILPLKWVLLLGSVFIWEYMRPGLAWLELDVFIVFFVYGLSILAIHYFFIFSKIPLHQVRMFCYGSYGVDLLYVTALIWLDHVHRRDLGLGVPDFHIIYFLLLIRGFVLYRSTIESVFVNVLISVLFVFSIWIEEQSLTFVVWRPFLVQIALVWMVILLAWFIFAIINRQKFELLRARERLHQSERLTGLGELAAGVAHEINNPIGIISAYAEYLIRQGGGDDPRREDYEVILTEAQRCKKIVGELLRFARPSETRREPTDLCALNEEVMRFIFHDRTDTTIHLEKLYAANLSWVLVDPTQIKQALLNVYVNALQALGVDGGEIRVSIGSVGRDAVQITIADTGRGIEAKDLARVFDPFFTRKPGGSGLGLTITRRLLEANDGEIELRPRKPKGIVAAITFRSLVAPPAPSAATTG